jgi:hypothetical protein
VPPTRTLDAGGGLVAAGGGGGTGPGDSLQPPKAERAVASASARSSRLEGRLVARREGVGLVALASLVAHDLALDVEGLLVEAGERLGEASPFDLDEVAQALVGHERVVDGVVEPGPGVVDRAERLQAQVDGRGVGAIRGAEHQVLDEVREPLAARRILHGARAHDRDDARALRAGRALEDDVQAARAGDVEQIERERPDARLAVQRRARGEGAERQRARCATPSMEDLPRSPAHKRTIARRA